jgi:redox-sensitive bicupin YhaK (pirin superfamily)
MMLKSVKYILPALEIDMGGMPIKQAIPTQRVGQIDPFLLLHHGEMKFTDRKKAVHQGIGPHPHRGFSPVTFVVEGEVHHRDSREHNQIAKAGEVQWINSGAGIIHSERPSEYLLTTENKRLELIQLWINTPADKKMDQPDYKHVPLDQMVRFQSEDSKIENKLITGSYQSLTGPFPTKTEQLIIWSEGNTFGSETYVIPTGFNTAIYLIKGTLFVKGHGLVDAENLIYFHTENANVQLEIKEDNTQFLILSGKPINENVQQHGPFVMNNETEILEAMRDYQMGKMGILIE